MYLLCHICLYLPDRVPVKVVGDQWDEFTLKNDLDLHEEMSPCTQGWPEGELGSQRVEGPRASRPMLTTVMED